ncbi:MAG: TIGR01244 family sulfur transferase [Wenzhouxiangella sp.]
MEIRRINEQLAVSPQITPADVAALRDAGFRSIICNRPDGEGADQPGFQEIESAARSAGMQALYQPIVSGKVRDEDAEAFGQALLELPGPVFAYCRTGTRSATLWSLSEARRTASPAR